MSSQRSAFVRVLVIVVLAAVVAVALVFMLRQRPRSSAARPRPEPAPVRTTPPATSAARAVAPAPGGAGQSEFDAAEAARVLKDPQRRSLEFGRALQAWIARDPDAVLAYVRGLPRTSWAYQQGALMILSAIAQRDADRAIKLAADMATSRSLQSFYSAVFADLADRNVERAVQRLADVPVGNARENALRAIAERWTRRDLGSVTRWAQSLEPADRAIAMESVAAELVGHDPLNAIQVAQQNLTGAALNRVLTTALAQLVTTDVSAAAGIVPLLPQGEAQTLAAEEVARALVERNPADALAWVEKLPADSMARRLAWKVAVETWAADDAASAAAYVQALPADVTQRQLAEPVARILAASDPQSALTWAQNLANPETRGAVLTQVVDAWAQKDPESAARWVTGPGAQALPGGGGEALNAALSYWVLQGSSGAESFVAGLSPALQEGAAAFVAPLLAQQDPTGALVWAQSLPDPAARNTAIEAAYLRWLENDRRAAAAWLARSNLPATVKARLTKP